MIFMIFETHNLAPNAPAAYGPVMRWNKAVSSSLVCKRV